MPFDVFLFWVIGGLTSACAIATVVTHNIVRCATWLLFTLAGTSALFFLIGADLVGAIQLLVYVGGTLVLVVFGVMLTAAGPFITMRTSSAEWGVSAATGIAFFALLLLAFMNGPIKINPQGPNEPNVAFARKKTIHLDGSKSPSTMIIGEGFAGVGVGPAHKDPSYRPIVKDKEPPLADPTKEEPKEIQKEPRKADIKDLDENLKNLKVKNEDKNDAAEVPVVAQHDPDPKKHDDAKKVEEAPPPEPAAIADAPGIIRTNYLLPFEIVSVHLLVVLIGAAYLARAKRREVQS